MSSIITRGYGLDSVLIPTRGYGGVTENQYSTIYACIHESLHENDMKLFITHEE